jgi:SAM-dependent methyltransferase
MSSITVTRGYGLLEGFLARKRVAIANALIPSGHRRGRILDIGCSEYPFFLLNTVFQERYGIDKCVHAERLNTSQGENIVLIQHDLESEGQIPLPSDYFDAVALLAVIEHVFPFQAADLLRNVYRLLRPNGICILTTPASWSDFLLRGMASLKLVSSVEIDDHKASYNHKQLGSLLEEAGFAKGKIRFGYFEFFLNQWATAIKQ